MSIRSLDEFRGLFGQEADGRLRRLNQLLLQLERSGSDQEVIGEIFREVHTLKGAAAVVGFDEVSQVAHLLEECLEELRAGRRSSTPELVDSLLVGVDGLSTLVAAAVGGHDLADQARVLSEQLVARLAAGDGATDERAADPAPTPLAVAPGPLQAEPGDPAATLVPREVQRPASSRSERPARPEPPSSRPAEARPDGGAIMVPVERLDELVRLVGEAASAHLRVGRMVQERLGTEPATVSELTELSRLLNELQERAMRARMVPVATITDQLQRAVRDVARSLGKDVRWEVRGADTELDRGVLHQLADSLLHVVRNAVDHGIESPSERVATGKPKHGVVRLHATQLGSEVIISVSDDGRGIDVADVRAKALHQGIDVDDLTDSEALQLIFRSGVSTAQFLSDISGRGVGLDVVRASVDAARGRIELRSEPGSGTELRLIVPITLAVLPCLMVEAGGQRLALPLHRVVIVHGSHVETVHAEGRRTLWHDGHPVPLASMGEVLGITPIPAEGPVVIVNGTSTRHAFQVEALGGQRDVVVKGLTSVVPRLGVIAGTSVDPDGSILVVLDPPGLVDRARMSGIRTATAEQVATVRPPHGRILVVDDAVTVRELQRSILERAGYEVVVAGDGVEALTQLAGGDLDLVLTDIEMPRMDGFALTEAIRQRPAIANIPILMLTSLVSDEHRQRGLEAGADGYIVKSNFDEQSLVLAVERLLGARVE